MALSLTRMRPFGSRPPARPSARGALPCPKCLGVFAQVHAFFATDAHGDLSGIEITLQQSPGRESLRFSVAPSWYAQRMSASFKAGMTCAPAVCAHPATCTCAHADVVLAVPSCRTGAQIAWTGSTRLPAAGATCSNRTRAASSPRFQTLRCATLRCCVSAMGLCLCRHRRRHHHRRHPHPHLCPHTRLCLHLHPRLWPHLHPRPCLHLCLHLLPRFHRHRPRPRPRLQPLSRSRLQPCS